MPTRTGSSSSRDRLREGEQPSYQPGGEYQPWDHDSGSLRLANGGDSRDAAFSDNGRGYYDDRLDNGRSSTRGREQIGEGKGGASDSLSNLRNAENDAASGREKRYYTGNGGKNNQKAKAKSNKRKAAVIGVIASLIVGGGAFLGSSNSLLAPAMSNLLTSATNTQKASNTIRAKLIATFASKGTAKSATWPTNGFSDSFLKKLESQGFSYTKSGKTTTLHFNGLDLDGNNFSEVYKSNPALRDAYDSARKGNIASFFDKPAEKYYSERGVSRNMWSSFKQSGDADADETAFNKTMTDRFDNSASTSAHSLSKGEHNETEKDPDTGEETSKVVGEQIGDSDSSKSTADSKQAAANSAEGYINKLAKGLAVVDAGCSLYRIGNLISMIIAAHSIYQSITYFQSFMENISKMMAGEGDASAINPMLNMLSTSVTADVPDGNGGYTQVKGAPLEAAGLQLVLGGAYGTLGAASIAQIGKSFSNERLSTTLFGNGIAASACAGAQTGSSIISLAVTLGGGVAGIVGNFLFGIAASVVTAVVASTVVSIMVPFVASLFLNTFEDSIGVVAGNVLMRGASAANTNLGRNANGQMPASAQQNLAYNAVNNEVIALEAEVDRMKHSPFDITNPNTFLGTIAYSLLPTITSTRLTSITSLTRSVSTSLASLKNNLTGNVFADGEGTSYMTTYGDCKDLGSINAVGDLYCNPATSTSVNGLYIEPDNQDYLSTIESQLDYNDSDDSYEIRDGSELYKYVNYCKGRTSPFGVADANILNELETDFGMIGSLPLGSDVANAINGIEDSANMAWATGEICVNDGEDEWASDGDFTYYQRYVEDQRLLTQMDMIDESDNTVSKLEAKYRENHPIDTSQAGLIVRYTGMTKDDAETAIAFIEYIYFIDNYDASSRIALKGNTTNPKTSADIIAEWGQGKYKEIQKNIVNDPIESKTIAKQHVIYFDIRNRSYAA